MSTLTGLIEEAKLAEQAERYEDMAKLMKEFTEKIQGPLSVNDRSILSSAYKNVVTLRRNSWRTLTNILKYESSGLKCRLIEEYIGVVVKELMDLCNEVLDLLDDHALKKCSDDYEAIVFYLKMKGDYYRYMCEVTKGDINKDMIENTRKVYSEAEALAKKYLTATSPNRLGLALNLSVFYYEITMEQEQACIVAKTAFDDAYTEMNTIQQADCSKDSTLIMQLLQDNLILWSPEVASTPPVHRELRVIPDFGDYIPPEGHFVEDKESFLARKAAEAIKYGNYDGL